MERLIGTVSRGIRAPIITQGDNLIDIVKDSVLKACASEDIKLQDGDIVAITESIVARAQGNYITVDDIAKDIKNLYGNDCTLGVIFPILSRNRFAICLKGIARGVKKIVLMLSYPSDEVGNHLADFDTLDDNDINPYKDVLTEAKYRELFGYCKHSFTGVDYIEYYKKIIGDEGCEAEIILANDCRSILNYTKTVLCCDIHTRERSKKLLAKNGADKVCGLDDLVTKPSGDRGYNEDYGLLGSNKATEERIKLFPRDGFNIVNKIKQAFYQATTKNIEVMIYGDGAFKDPVGKIWELADPVVSPGYTDGLIGQPNELKLKYLADNNFADLKGEQLIKAVTNEIRNKKQNLEGDMASQGTTPRRITDLIGSLCDLTSGSGDKGTPIILIQNYFDNYSK